MHAPAHTNAQNQRGARGADRRETPRTQLVPATLVPRAREEAVPKAADALVALVREGEGLRARWLSLTGDRWQELPRRLLRARLRTIETDARRLAEALERAIGLEGAREACAAAVDRLEAAEVSRPPAPGAWDPQP